MELSGQAQIQNWAGSIGANVAATGFQFIGLAAYLLPLLLFAAAWRRFRPSTGFKSWMRIVGIVVLVVAAAGLLSISQMRPLFDGSVQAGGLLGAVVAQGLASGLSNIGATILLVAIAQRACCSRQTSRSFDFTKSSRALSVRGSRLFQSFRNGSERGANNESSKRNAKGNKEAIKAEREAAKERAQADFEFNARSTRRGFHEGASSATSGAGASASRSC